LYNDQPFSPPTLTFDLAIPQVTIADLSHSPPSPPLPGITVTAYVDNPKVIAAATETPRGEGDRSNIDGCDWLNRQRRGF
jgi:hypothetical protein